MIDADFTIVSPGSAPRRRSWNAKLKSALTTIACVALAGLALPPMLVAAYLLNAALTR